MTPLSIPVFGTALTSDSGIWETCRFLLVGLGIVMVTLAGIACCCMALGWVFQAAERRRLAKAKADEATSSDTAVEPETIDPAIPAVIAAAVAAVLQEPHRIVAVMTPVATEWSLEGRRAHVASRRRVRG